MTQHKLKRSTPQRYPLQTKSLGTGDDRLYDSPLRIYLERVTTGNHRPDDSTRLIYLERVSPGPKNRPSWLLRWPDSPHQRGAVASKLALSTLLRSGAVFLDVDANAYVVAPFVFSYPLRPRSQAWTLSLADTQALARTVVPDVYGIAVSDGTEDHCELAKLDAYLNPGRFAPRALPYRFAGLTPEDRDRPLITGWGEPEWALAERMYNEGTLHIRAIRDFLTSLE